MTVRTARKIGFFTAMGLLFGSIVGIGIFVKNGSVFRATGSEAVTTILAWVIGGIVSLFAAISFSEIGSLKTRNVHGLGAWSEVNMGKRTGYLVRFNLAFFYNIVIILVIGMFVSEIFFVILQTAGIDVRSINQKIYVHVIIGVVFIILFITVNFLSVYFSGIISTVASVIKFLPLIIAAVMGVALVGTNHQYVINGADGKPLLDEMGNVEMTKYGNLFEQKPSFSFTALLTALPSILFAYDSFLAVGPLAAKTKGGVKTISKVTLVTMILVVVLYSFITVSQMLHNTKTIEALFQAVLDPSAANAISIMIYSFILVSAFGVLNGISSSLVASIQQAILTDTFFWSKRAKAKFGAAGSFALYFGISFLVAIIIMYIPAIALNTDVPADTFSNLPTIYFFAIYGANILFYLRKRNSLETQKLNKVLFYFVSITAIGLIALIVGYELFYEFSIQAFISPNKKSSHGGFADWVKLTLIEEFGFLIAGLVVFFGAPLLNYWLKKRFEKENPIIDTQALMLEPEVELQSRIREAEVTDVAKRKLFGKSKT